MYSSGHHILRRRWRSWRESRSGKINDKLVRRFDEKEINIIILDNIITVFKFLKSCPKEEGEQLFP